MTSPIETLNLNKVVESVKRILLFKKLNSYFTNSSIKFLDASS